MVNKLELIKKINKDKQTQKIKRLKSLGKDPSLLFLPIITEIITQKISEINNIFVNLEKQLQLPKVDSNSLYNQIHSVERKIIEINKLIDKLNVVITTFQIIVTTLKVLPLPTAPIPTTVGIINTFTNLLEKATKIISIFKIIKSIIDAEMKHVQNNFDEIKNEINNTNPNTSDLKNNNIKIGTYPEIYNGFKFAIREENTNDSIKRHYAVAIDTSGVEVLKTNKSYTLDVEVLIDELKLIIDKNNLKA